MILMMLCGGGIWDFDDVVRGGILDFDDVGGGTFWEVLVLVIHDNYEWSGNIGE